jgi:hypothetical protein
MERKWRNREGALLFCLESIKEQRLFSIFVIVMLVFIEIIDCITLPLTFYE